MPTITQGVTFEVDTISAAMDDGLQARIHDPLWLLARQWQFGEYQGGDGGSAARVALNAGQAPITRYQPAGSTAALAYSPLETPLEVIVEREPVPPAGSRRLGLLAEAGLHFLRLLAANGAGAYRAAYRSLYALERPPAETLQSWDGESLRTLDLYAGRVPDAGRLYQVLSAALGPDGTGTGPLPAQPAIPAADQPKVRSAASAWLQWVAAQGFSPNTAAPAWMPERMEYGFAVAARPNGQEVVLAAPEYHGGRLDWDAFAGRAGTTLGAPISATSDTYYTLPSPVTYRGIPASRLWAFEDGRVNLGAVDDGSPDLATLLLIEFALIYGSDWFITPLEVEVGSLSYINSLVVYDSFNIPTTIAHYSQSAAGAGSWRWFALTPESSAADTDILKQSLLLAPALGAALESPPVEEVLFLRDEMANMAWAVERVVPGQAGRPLDRYEAYQEQRRRETAATPPQTEDNTGQYADLIYKLGTTVPDYWIPLLPEEFVSPAGEISMRLRRGAMPRFGPDGAVTGIVPPLGSLLRPNEALSLYEEEVPREGARVKRAAQFCRWINGSSHLWIGARKRPGRGEGSSGLQFDTAEPV